MEDVPSPEFAPDDGGRPLEQTRSIRAAADDEYVVALDERVEQLLDLLGKAHAASILRLFAVDGGPWRFSEIQDRIDASPHTLSKRLSELTAAGLLERHVYAKVPPRVEYTWTQSARDLSPAFQHLYGWAREYDPAPEEVPSCGAT